ncbi:Crp/Fnr family transcriptional regulator [Gynurincola endophyticus]|jgi:CRP-like cAMP-binding protein|uniref:Crp/Fnr family transcriptional regulator n=1 Tax=Gynurincola endophyticus TaxID=2479004 RepID=UPI000F8E0FBC|nr:Crp/Fnr family transcriptional regulator [Gynurincola endophyticus]
MSQVLKAHINKFLPLNDEEYSAILPYLKVQKVKKKQNLMTEGEICKQHYFVEKGCLRKFFINEKGVEQTTEFAIENWWMTDHIAYERQHATLFNIQAVEHTEIVILDYQSQEKLFEQFSFMERYFRFVYQRAFAATQMRIKFLFDYSKEEMYHHFIKTQGAFAQRIPQYLLASYLGLTPEYLSEIRAKRFS